MTAPESIERMITQMLSVGKKIALGSIPARVVLSILQHPKHTPIQEATASFCGRKAETVFSFDNSAKSIEAAAASINAMNKNTVF